MHALPRQSGLRRKGALGLKLLLLGVAGLCALWGALAVYYTADLGETTRTVLAVGLVLVTLLAFAVTRLRWRTYAAFLLCFAVFVGWWYSLPPSNNRVWQTDVAVLPYAELDGDLVTVRNIRNFTYRTEHDYDPGYYDKTFDLRTLDSVDLIAVYWMGDAIAHVMLSFGFAGQDYLCLSIETRKEVGEAYSSLKGFFKQYELIYIAADERDVLRLRTDYRVPPEDVYLYRTRMPLENARKLFLVYAAEMNDLREHPRFYNTLTTNCTTNVVRNLRAMGGKASYNWQILLSGYAPQYAYAMGALNTSLPFEALRTASLLNPKARAAAEAPNYSRFIRQGLP